MSVNLPVVGRMRIVVLLIIALIVAFALNLAGLREKLMALLNRNKK